MRRHTLFCARQGLGQSEYISVAILVAIGLSIAIGVYASVSGLLTVSGSPFTASVDRADVVDGVLIISLSYSGAPNPSSVSAVDVGGVKFYPSSDFDCVPSCSVSGSGTIVIAVYSYSSRGAPTGAASVSISLPGYTRQIIFEVD